MKTWNNLKKITFTVKLFSKTVFFPSKASISSLRFLSEALMRLMRIKLIACTRNQQNRDMKEKICFYFS